MKCRLFSAIVLIAVLSLGFSGCELISKDLIGTWNKTDGGNTLTITFEGRTISFSESSPAGSVSFSVEATDSDAGHIDTTVTEATGGFSGYTVGTKYYWLYEIQSDGLYIMFATVPYPPTTQSGPFTKVL